MDQKPGIDKNFILAMLLCAALWFGWQSYLEKKYPEAMHPKTPDSVAQTQSAPTSQLEPKQGQTTAEAAAQTTEVAAKKAPGAPEQNWKYEDDNWKIIVSNYGGRISDVILKKYLDRDNEPVNLVGSSAGGYLSTRLEGPAKNLADAVYTIKELAPNKVELSTQGSGIQIKKILTVNPFKYSVDAETEISGQTTGIKRVDFDVTAPAPEAAEAQGIGATFSQIFSASKPSSKTTKGPESQEYFFSFGSKTDRETATPEKRVEKNVDQSHFASLGSRYFTVMLYNRGDVLPTAQALPQGDLSVLRFNYPVLEGSSGVIKNKMTLYAGPKLLNELQQVDESAGQVMDLGKFSWIAIPLLKLMKLFFELFKNWGAAIIGLTILVRLLTYPFTYMSYRSMKNMQKIQPEMNRVREKYKDNPTLMNQEVMRLWKENKVNPMGGCLPMLLQLPVFWALYTVLQNSIELYHSPFIFWIKDLSLKDPYFVLPVLMGATMFIQQKMTPNTMDPAQARMMMFMPIFFSFIMMNLPAGLTLYIFVSTLFGIIQQYFAIRDKTTPGGRGPVTVVGTAIRDVSK